MKPKIMSKTLAAICGLMLTTCLGFSQGTAFTYQGQLESGGSPVTGLYDFTNALYNASSGGAQVGSTVTLLAVPVTNGLFTVILDFGAVFNGTSYWLQIGVRSNGVGSYVALSPRQELTPTPYAIAAENLIGLLPSGGLSGTYPDPVNLSNPGNSFTGGGAGLTGLNASHVTTGTLPDSVLSGNVALRAGGNTFTGNQVIDAMLTVSDGSGAGTYTDVVIGPGGYFAGEEHSINFNDGSGHIGSLEVGYNGSAGYFSVGNLYYSTYQPGTKAFTVWGNGNVNVDPDNLNNGFLNSGNTNSSGLTFGLSSGEGIASKRTAGGNQYGLDFYTGYSNRMSIWNSGQVAIGTVTPVGNSTVDIEGSTTYEDGLYVNSPTFNANGIEAVADVGSAAYAVYAHSAGGVGVYTTSPSGSALTIGSGAIHVSGATTNATTTSSTTAAFTQVASAANIPLPGLSDYTVIYNTLCDGDPNAVLLVTPNYNPRNGASVYWNHVVGVWYTGTHWAIFNEDQTAMPSGPAFNVLVIKN
jgi:hypothetical protein